VVDIVIISPFGVIVNTERRFFMADLKIIENELVPVYETEK
jgi:hypothetical protein